MSTEPAERSVWDAERIADLRRVAAEMRSAEASDAPVGGETVRYVNATQPDVILSLLDALEGCQREATAREARATRGTENLRRVLAQLREKTGGDSGLTSEEIAAAWRLVDFSAVDDPV